MCADLSRILPHGLGEVRPSSEGMVGQKEVTWTTASGTPHKVRFLEGTCNSKLRKIFEKEQGFIEVKLASSKGKLFFSKKDVEALGSGSGSAQVVNVVKGIYETTLIVAAKKAEAEAQETEADGEIVEVAPDFAYFHTDSGKGPTYVGTPAEAVRLHQAKVAAEIEAKKSEKEARWKSEEVSDRKRAAALGVSDTELKAIKALRERVFDDTALFEKLALMTRDEKSKLPPKDKEDLKFRKRIVWTEKGPQGEPIQRSVRVKMREGKLYFEVRGKEFGKGGFKRVEDVRAWAFKEGEDTRIAYLKIHESKMAGPDAESASKQMVAEKEVLETIAKNKIPCAVKIHGWRSEKSYAYRAIPYTQGDCEALNKMPDDPVKGYQGSALKDRVSCALDMARFLKGFHALGMVHGDIKPGNALYDSRGKDGRLHVCVTDFGSARKMGESIGDITDYYVTKDTTARSTADPSQDMYALGVVLREFRYGHREPKNRWKESTESLYSPLMKNDSYDTIVGRLLKKEMTAAQAVDALESLLTSSPIDVFGAEASSSEAVTKAPVSPSEEDVSSPPPPPPPLDDDIPPPQDEYIPPPPL